MIARPVRICYPGALYHAIARGNNRERIVRDDKDRIEFLAILARALERYGVLCHAYCLLDNHYHLVVETPLANLPLFMRQLNGFFARYVNKQHGRIGHVFQARYRSILVEKESYFLAVCRYVLLNPVRAGICARPDEYHWSSYRETAGLISRGALLCSDSLLSQFAPSRPRAEARYREFVALGSPNLNAEVRGERLGSDEFLKRDFKLPTPLEEVPRRQWQPDRRELAEIFATEPTPIATAYRDHDYRLAEIACFLGYHYSTISRKLATEEQQVRRAA